jgi:lipopolysaccharide biosynthesis regulator YciM
MATTLIERLDRVDRALPILGSVLEKAPADAAARGLAFDILRSSPAVRARAGELLEHASAAGDSPEEQRVLIEQLLETTGDAEKDATTQLSKVRRRWFERLFELTRGEPSFAVAERAALEFPGDDAVWGRLELLSCQLGDPQKALRAHMGVLAGPLPAEVAEMLGRRIVAFAEERAQSQELVTTALERVLELSPGARWAVDRVKLALTAERRWPALFALYDRAAEAIGDADEKADLLDEAAIAARDVAGDFDRAIDYWERVSRLRPGDARIDLTLERLYEKRGLVAKLIPHLVRRAESQSGAQRRSLRERIAALWLDLQEGASALEILEDLLTGDPGNETAHRLLERLFALEPRAENEVAVKRAGDLLKQRYARAGHTADVARLLERELAKTTSPSERVERLKSLFEIHQTEGGDRSRAFECLGELVALEPTIRAHREQLAKWAAELDADARRAELLVIAAERTTGRGSIDLLLEAAEARAERLSDAEGAAELYVRVLLGAHQRAAQVTAARALSRLLDEIVRPEPRCKVLEHLASFETDPGKHRARLLEAARVALEELGDAGRAVGYVRPLALATPSDRDVQNRFVQALRASGNHAELADALAARAADSEGIEARRDLIEIARIRAERLSEPLRAIEIWRDVRRRFGRDAESFEALAGLLEGSDQWQELAALLSEETSEGTPQPQLFARLGDVHRDHTGDSRAAALAYVAAGDPEKALRTLEGDDRFLLKDPSLCLMIAAALRRAGRLSEAEALLRRNLDQEGRRRTKEHGEVRLALVDVLRAAGREKDAFEQLALAAETYPTDPKILETLARSAFERGDLDRAEKTYQALLLLLRHSSDGRGASSSRAEVYVELGELARRRDETDKARDLTASALELALDDDRERPGLERALRRHEKFDVLENALESHLESAQNPVASARALAALASFHRERDGLTEARAAQLAERAERVRRELGPRPADVPAREGFQKLAEVYARLDHAEQAVELLDVLVASADAEDDAVRFGLEAAQLLVDVPFRHDEAATRLQTIRSRSATRPEVALLLARVLEEEGRFEEALAVHQSLPADRGHEREHFEAIVRLEQARGAPPARMAEALGHLLDVEQGARRAAVALRLSALHGAQGDAAAKERALELGFEADPTRPDLRDALVGAYAARGAFARAASVLDRALSATSDDSLRWRLSELHEKAGDTKAALGAVDFVPASRAEKAELGRRRSALLEAAGRTEEALGELESAYRIDTRCGTELLAAIQRTKLTLSSERWMLLAADLFVRYGEPAKARQTLEAWLEANPTSRPALNRLARLEPTARTPQKPAQALFDAAEKHLAADELVEALDALSQAHRLDKSDTQVSFLLGLVALDLDRVDVASAALRAFVATRAPVVSSTTDEPSPVSRAYFHLAVIEHTRGDDGAARRMVSRAMEESPNNRDARRLMEELRASPLGN